MLEQADGLLFNQLGNHVTQDGTDSVESLISGTDIPKANIIKQDLLHDKDGHRLAQLGARLHDAKAKWDNLSGQQEIDDIRRVILDQSADNTERSETQVFEGSRFGSRVQEWVEEQRYMSCVFWSAFITTLVNRRGLPQNTHTHIPFRKSVRVSL